MKQQEVFKKIGGIIKELNEQYDYLKTVEGPLNELELELFIANSHFLTDHVVILNKLNSQSIPGKTHVEKAETPVKEKYFEPLVQNPVSTGKGKVETAPETPAKSVEEPIADVQDEQPGKGIDLETGSGEDSYSFIREEEPETIRHELILDETENWEDEEDEIKKTDEEEVIDIPPVDIKPVHSVKKEEAVHIADKPKPDHVKHTAKDEVFTINDKISAQMGEKSGIAEQLHVQSVSDLKQAINLNDKLLYIKELFNGYSLAYSEAIEILNRFNSFDEADLFLKKNYVAKNNWDSKPDTTGKFYALLKRRYA